MIHQPFRQQVHDLPFALQNAERTKGISFALKFFIRAVFIFSRSNSKIGLRLTVDWFCLACRSSRFLPRASHPNGGKNLITETALTQRLPL